VSTDLLDEVKRLHVGSLLLFGFVALLVYLSVVSVGGLAAVGSALQSADYWWVLVILTLSAATYVGAALQLSGSAVGSLPPLLTLSAQFASSFANLFAPAGAGGYAVNGRFLEQRGFESAIAVAAVGLMTVVGVTVHAAATLVFILWVGSTEDTSFDLPTDALVLVIVVFVGVAGVSLALRSTRRWILRTLVPAVGRSLHAVKDVAARPSKLTALFGGAVLVTLGNLGAFAAAVAAVGGGAAFPQIGVAYLLGTAAAAAVPAPGGIGATEAALYAGLVAIGIDGGSAVSAVLLFRLGTFWLPILPGWIAYRHLRHVGAL
jgi:uncharacterized membrane protein YbhN (UPF0104 family)